MVRVAFGEQWENTIIAAVLTFELVSGSATEQLNQRRLLLSGVDCAGSRVGFWNWGWRSWRADRYVCSARWRRETDWEYQPHGSQGELSEEIRRFRYRQRPQGVTGDDLVKRKQRRELLRQKNLSERSTQ